MPTETVDAVVVGAGHNGLVAATLLADAGWDVLVLEATELPGGAVRSAELTAPGHVTDLCSAFYPMAAASPVIQELRLEDHGLRWTHAPDVLAHVLPDGRAVVLNRDPEVTAANLEAFAAGDGRRWLDMYERWLGISEPLLAAMLRPFPPVRPAVRLLRAQPASELLRLARQMVLPVRSLADAAFAGDGAKALIGGLALHADLGPDQAASGVFGWLLAMLAQQYGFPVPVGGAQHITDALLRRFDGEVRCGTPVDRVVVAGGRALGVSCVDGSAVRVRRAVLCDVPAPTLYGTLVAEGQLPPRLLDDLGGFEWDSGTVKVDWALSGPVPWTSPAVRTAGTVHLDADLDGLSRYAFELSTGTRPTAPFLLSGQMAVADPIRAPAGAESLWVYTHVPHRNRWNAAEVDDHVRRIETVLGRHAPGFTDLVVGRHVAGPDDLQVENPSLIGGAIDGGTAAPHQQLVFRPVPGLGRADTPVDRLYLASASAHPGGAVHGAPGANAARAALARWRPILGTAHRTSVQTALGRIYRQAGQRVGAGGPARHRVNVGSKGVAR